MKKENENKRRSAALALRGGVYSLIITVVVLAVLIAVNVFAESLPATYTKPDISSSKLYSITSNTKVVVNGLKDDVTIYWIVQADQENTVLERLLEKYESLSDHLTVVKRNPDVYPTFVEKYTDEQAQNNSLVVECGDRSRYIAYDDIFVTDMDMYAYTYTTEFDGEGAITSAIDYVTSDDLPKVYLVEGHGEADLPQGFADTLTKENIETDSLSLAAVDAIPEDADAVMIYAPQSDISEEEKTMLAGYIRDGGKLLALAGPVEDGALTNLTALLENYGVTAKDGIVVEADRAHYGFQQPLILIPDLGDSQITQPLTEDRYFPMLPIAQGLVTSGDVNGTVTELLTTSDTAFSKLAGFDLNTYEKEEGDIDGPFALAVDIEDDGGGELIWFGSGQFLEDMYNAYSSGANSDLVMNALSQLIGEREALAIRSKSLNYNYLTISESTSNVLKAVMIGLVPLAFLGIGIAVVIRRRRLTNETV